MTPEQENEALAIAIDIVASKLKNIDSIPPEQKEALSGLISTIRMLPNRYKTGSVTPYYKEKYARMVKESIADVIAKEPHTPLVVDALSGKTKQSIQQLISQGFLYLIERNDTPDGYYRKLRTNIKVKAHPAGVLIEWRDIGLGAREYKEVIETKSWQETLDEFIENSVDGATLELPLGITIEELDGVKQQLSDISDKFVALQVSQQKLILQHNERLAQYAYNK